MRFWFPAININKFQLKFVLKNIECTPQNLQLTFFNNK